MSTIVEPAPLKEAARHGESDSSLRIYFIPFPSPGHVLPMLDMARLVVAGGGGAVEATVLLTPLFFSRLSSAAAPPRLRLHQLPFPSSADSQYRDHSNLFAAALLSLVPHVSNLLSANPPDALIADFALPWASFIAARLSIPLYTFPGSGCFPLFIDLQLLLHRPHAETNEPFIVPGLPDRVSLTRDKVIETLLPGARTKEYLDAARQAQESSLGFVVNTFPDLEPGYVDHYERITGKKVFAIGPVSMANRTKGDRAERGRGVEGLEMETRIMDWLEGKPPGSVLYVCFGSLSLLPWAQAKEIGIGLEKSMVSFIWVMGRVVEGDEEEEEVGWLEEMEKRVEKRGMVVRGWVPQLSVLSHDAVGGFLSHCGWGSVAEAAAAGVAVLTWPLFAEQFYNERLVVEILRVGVSMGAEVGFVWGEEEKAGVVMGWRRIAEKVRWFMGGADAGGGGEVEEVRRRAVQLGEKARRAVEPGGSSYMGVRMLIKDLNQHHCLLRSAPATDLAGGELVVVEGH